ncbi:hypothetical protein HZS_4076, partial [Henneguya salminicola]
MDLRPSDSFIVTGGVDKCGVVFNRNSDKVVTVLKGHTKKVTEVVFHPSLPIIVTGSADTQVRIWDQNLPKSKKIIKCHSDQINGVSFHPLGDYILTSAADKLWTFTDINSGSSLIKKSMSDIDCDVTCSQIHPDGLIFATGTSLGPIHIWDFKACNNVVTFEEHTDQVNSVAFSENGYHMASIGRDFIVRIWDLRKTKCVHSIDFKTRDTEL